MVAGTVRGLNVENVYSVLGLATASVSTPVPRTPSTAAPLLPLVTAPTRRTRTPYALDATPLVANLDRVGRCLVLVVLCVGTARARVTAVVVVVFATLAVVHVRRCVVVVVVGMMMGVRAGR
jgi:hypothetical protein